MKTPDPGEEFEARRFSAQDGLSLYFRDYGRGLRDATPVLCLPGLTRNSQDFDRIARWLSAPDGPGAARRVICPDLRGRGKSSHDPNWRNYQPAVYLNDLQHLLTVAAVHRVVALGTSLGGLLAMALAVARPTVIAGAVLNDVGPEVNATGLEKIIDYISVDQPQSDWDSAVAFLKRTFPGMPARTEEDWLLIARGTFVEAADGELRYGWDLAIAEPLKRRKDPLPDLWPLYGALGKVPVLALRGESSDILSANTLEEMENRRDGEMSFRAVTVGGVGHAPSLAEPDAMDAFSEFLQEIDARESLRSTVHVA